MQKITRHTLPFLLAVLGGAICTIIVSLLVASCSPQPTIFGMLSFPSQIDEMLFSRSESDISDSDRLYGSLATGFGYTSLDMRWYGKSMNEKLEPGIPLPLKRRAFLTKLGWPNVAFATNARSLGLRMANKHKLRPNSPSDTLLHDGKQTTVQILWSGFIWDSLLFATPFLMLWMFFRRNATFYLPRTLLVSLCLGLWFAMFVAWGCDLAHHTFVPVPKHHNYYEKPTDFDSSVRPIDIPSSTEWNRFGGSVDSSIGYSAWSFSFGKVEQINGTTRYVDSFGSSTTGFVDSWGESSLKLGWPFTCLKGPQISQWTRSGEQHPWPHEANRRHVVALMAMPVWWPGMLANWLFYALVTFTVLRGPKVLLRHYRKYRHRCMMCGYPIGEGNRCTECGSPITKQKKSTPNH